MIAQPTLNTQRLILRPFVLEDAVDIQKLLGEFEVASPLLSVPHPYEDGMAEKWILHQREEYETGKNVIFAITHRENHYLIGCIGLEDIKKTHENAETGYWLGKQYWGQSYCTEAACAVLRFGFENLSLHRVYARHMTRNPASGRVMQKIGMTHEGHLREDKKRWDIFEDFEIYGILKDEFRP